MHGRHTRARLGARLAFGIGIVITLVAPPAANASGFRLFRHRSGYLFGAADPCPHGGVRYDPYYGGAGYGFGGGGGLDPYADYMQRDFDARRDRLLDHAARVDVSYLRADTPRAAPETTPNTYPGTTAAQTKPVDDTGWVFLREGEAVKALGKFAARILLAPGDAQARVGYALAAAMLDDPRAAAQSMRTAVRFDEDVLREFESDEALERLMRGLIAKLDPGEGAGSADATFMIASLHGLLGEHDAGRLALADLGADERDSATEVLCALLSDPAPTVAAASPSASREKLP